MLDFTSLQIYTECQYRKNLDAGEYKFNTFGIKDFYGKNVALHAIVGKNGSGKSSLLDIMLRIINNVGALMCMSESRDASDSVRYVRHIYADLAFVDSFVIEGDLISMAERDKIHHGVISVRDTALWIEFDDDVYWMSDTNICNRCPDWQRYSKELYNKYGSSHYHDYSDLKLSDRKHKLAAKLFYTIATNYSMLGFQSNDYEDEDSLEYDDKIFIVDSEGRFIVNNDGKYKITNGWTEKKNWITGIFHKNDGYMCPLVLNPYRDRGKINMNNEASLTVSRLSALLIKEHMDENPLIDDYYLDYIEYERKKDFYLRFKPIILQDDKERKNQLADDGDLNLFMQAALTENTWTWTVLDELKIQVSPVLSKTEIAARLYIVYKIFNIAATYPHYSEYRKYGKIDKVFYCAKMAPTPSRLRKLVNEIVSRKTHVEQKVHQVLRFIRCMDALRERNCNLDTEWQEKPFTYKDYISHISTPEEFKNLDECMRNMPPNIFRQTIYLKRKVKGEIIASKIPFNRMSSGQKQILYQLSTLLYHMVNLRSVPQDEIRYHNVNIILDEIEVCFHPEYQRMFLMRFIELICNTLHLNDDFGIHIWLTTHSPFILSDIPESLITYMYQGHPLTEGEKSDKHILPPMAANVSDLLHQSFFLDKGFIGEYARNKILNAISYLRDENEDKWTKDTLHCFINGIGEPFIRKNLINMWEKKYAKNFD